MREGEDWHIVLHVVGEVLVEVGETVRVGGELVVLLSKTVSTGHLAEDLEVDDEEGAV